MSDSYGRQRTIPADRADMGVDAGLRSFMLGVYNKMAVGLLVSSALAYGVGMSEQLTRLLVTGPIGMVILFAPLALILIANFVMRNPSPTGANIIYWGVVATMGISLGGYVYIYSHGYAGGMFTIIKALLTTAGAFGALALWGYTTKRDLSGFGTFLVMGVFGLIIAMVINMFLQSSALDFAISVIGVLVFAGLAAFRTQQLKYAYFDLGGDTRSMSVVTTYGALSLYMTFINLFLFILRLMSPRN